MASSRSLLDKIDIVEVVSSYIELRRVGNNFVARCPFHPDDTPSFYVSPSKGIFKCFGCGVGGDAVKFVSLYENIDYWEALEKLAKRYNIPLNVNRKSADDKLLLALQLVADFYHQELASSKPALQYLQSRGINSSTIKKFHLGFAGSVERLVNLLKREGLLEVYEKSGNILKAEKDLYHDLFRHRLVIPIRGVKGEVLAFGGRSLDGSHPKYINSPESEVFKKKSTLFGLYEAKEYIKEQEEVTLVEGYFDLMSLWQAGIRNCVAPLGTAFTEEHARLLSKFTKRVVLLYDGDEAGKKAVKSSVPHLLKVGMKVRVAYLPEGEDPDSLVKKDPELLKNLLRSAPTVEVDLLEKVKRGQKGALEDLLHFCSYMPDSVARFDLLKEVAGVIGLPLADLQRRLVKVEIGREREEQPLSYPEVALLAFLYRFGFEGVSLEGLSLSPYALSLVEALRLQEYHLIPERIKNFKAENMHSVLMDSLKALSLPEVEVFRDFQHRREKSTSKPRKIRKRV